MSKCSHQTLRTPCHRADSAFANAYFFCDANRIICVQSQKANELWLLRFSTLDKRKYFCEEELRLNRRLAPDLYLSVLPIIETDGKYHFDRTGDGVAVEYAIAMPEFAQEDLLIEMFASGRLTSDHVIQIGKQLAAFHQQAKTNDHINSFGTMESVRAVANDNYASTEKYIGLAQTLEQFTQTREYTERFLQKMHRYLAIALRVAKYANVMVTYI